MNLPLPRVNQCMSCFYSKGATECSHWNANNPNDPGFCYDYECVEDHDLATKADARDELIDRRDEGEDNEMG